jgi:predicted PurR-regulated permease PerM
MSIQRTSFYVLLALVTTAFIWLLIPYYTAVFWAVILAIIFFPVHKRRYCKVSGLRKKVLP